jgi:hypothetical protein
LERLIASRRPIASVPIRTPQRPRRGADIAKGAALGRIYRVIRETWRLKDDPELISPAVEVVASRRSAAEAADLAREAAARFKRRGYHKPSRAWWASDGKSLHRFRVEAPSPPKGLTVALASAAAGLLVVTAARALQRRRKDRA